MTVCDKKIALIIKCIVYLLARRCAVWIVERMRYQPTNRQTDTASYRGALAQLKSKEVREELFVNDDVYCKRFTQDTAEVNTGAWNI